MRRETIRAVGQQVDSVGRHFCACLDDMLETNGLAGPFGFYLFSLSRHPRSPAAMGTSMATGARGYAIGFAPSLFAATQSELNEQANENIHVGRVIYGDAATVGRHRLVIEKAARITSEIAHRHRDVVTKVRPSVYLGRDGRAKSLLPSWCGIA